MDDTAVGLGLGLGMFFILFIVALVVLIIASFWVVFTKAGQPGWASIIPIYNMIVMLQIAGKPTWWFLLMLLPLVNIVIAIMVVMAIAKNFGKSDGFGIGLLLLPMIFYPMLAWGDARYNRVA